MDKFDINDPGAPSMQDVITGMVAYVETRCEGIAAVVIGINTKTNKVSVATPSIPAHELGQLLIELGEALRDGKHEPTQIAIFDPTTGERNDH